MTKLRKSLIRIIVYGGTLATAWLVYRDLSTLGHVDWSWDYLVVMIAGLPVLSWIAALLFMVFVAGPIYLIGELIGYLFVGKGLFSIMLELHEKEQARRAALLEDSAARQAYLLDIAQRVKLRRVAAGIQ